MNDYDYIGEAEERDLARAEARQRAGDLAKVPLDERIGDDEGAAARERGRAFHAEAEAAARAPRRLRLNVTQGPLLSPGYVVCSAFQSDNGVNWACAGTQITFSENWFRAVFGEPREGQRIEFEISNPHEVTG